jgi:hypothetical protein
LPPKILEIGSGTTTAIMLEAIRRNRERAGAAASLLTCAPGGRLAASGFLLLFCSPWLPGLALMLSGSAMTLWLLGGTREVGPVDLVLTRCWSAASLHCRAISW